ncbi:MAG: sulfatase-like hydrolase/transferase [Bacteroidaceae bacterium]|nr:sulfatase-like hydrolase/transferase [Bacteroidaceae bacterium]
MKKKWFIPTAAALLPAAMAAGEQKTEQPNIILIYIDDMGYSDPSAFGGKYTQTPNIDRIGEEGIMFSRYYTACPISSPSRSGLTTGMYPCRWGVTNFLDSHSANANFECNDFLSDKAPSMARALRAGGYATGHFGKWHMGGGRDVKNAPPIPNYGFDEYNSTWESPDPDPQLTASNWIWCDNDPVKRWDRTAYFIDKTLDFLKRHPDQPCFVNLWPDDVHTPWVYENDQSNMRESAGNFTVVLKELDVQIGRLMQGLKDLGIDENTLVIFTSDNGPAPAFNGNRTEGLRGQKASLYEGGVRMPFMIRWPGHIEAGQRNEASVLCSVDLFPSLCAIAGAPVPTDYVLDGEDMSKTLLGEEKQSRTAPIHWEFGKHRSPRLSPHIAILDGNWKLLVNADGSETELYNIITDANETTNVATRNPEITMRLKADAIAWYRRAFREYADIVIRVATDGDAAADGSDWEHATTLQHATELATTLTAVQVWLKAGTYQVAKSLNIDNIALYGGFSGTESGLYERDWAKNVAIIDGGGVVSPLRNSLNTTVSTVVDGVTVQNGINQAGANGNGNGGGMIINGGTKVRNCVFRGNRTQNAKNGAAIHCNVGTFTIENCLFYDNTSSGNGGAVQVGGGCTATITNCTFADNTAAKPGGAIGLGNNTSNVNIYNCVAWHNKGGSAYNSYGQNDDMNGGGTVIARFTSIQTQSTKFTDGDDEQVTFLTEEKKPQFVEGGYQLAEGSPCIDAGNASLLANTEFDLAHNARLSGKQLDQGAYEADQGGVIGETAIIRVRPDGNPDSDGSTWEQATTVQHAVSLAASYINDAQLWLQQGTYNLTASLNVDDVQFYGGFQGTETTIGERDWAANPTILDGGDKVSPLRSSNLTKKTTTVIDGLTIQHGLNQTGANGNGNGGGALLMNGTVVRNCIFRDNRTQNTKNGAAIHCQSGRVTIQNTLFTHNVSTGNGGAVQIGGDTTADIINCTFCDNQASNPGGALGTGNNTSNVNLYNTVAYNNVGGGKRNSYGQNADMNAGGTVIAVNSAVESSSKKFADGDDTNVLILSQTVQPGLDDNYCPTAGSALIDAGDDSYIAELPLDLSGAPRMSGSHVDIGAYEFASPTKVERASASDIKIMKHGENYYVLGTKPDTSIAVYTTDGSLLSEQIATSNLTQIQCVRSGVYILKVGTEVFKVLI